MRQHKTLGTPIFRGLALILSAAALLAGQAHASQTDDPDIDSTQLSIEELMDARIAKVVSASRYEQRITEAPASVTVITADEISKFGYRTLADILRSIPGVYVTYDRNYSYIGIRGVNRPGDYNSRVLLLIDGHRLNDNIYDSAPIGTEFPLDIDLIDHIEFVRGPGSSLYGSNAFFGTINVFTRKADNVKRELAISAGDNETWKGRTSYGARYDSGLEVLLSGSALYSNGQRNIYYPEYANDPNGSYYRNNDYDDAKSFYSRFSYGDFTLSGLYQTREKGVPTGPYGSVFNSKPNYSMDDRGYVDLSYQRNLADNGILSARVYYDAYVYHQKYTYDKSGGLPYVINEDTANGRWWGAETVVTVTPLENHRLSIGGEFKHNLTGAQANFDVAPYKSYLDDNRHSINWGLFIQDEYRIFQPLLLNVGFRYDNYDNFDSVNPRVSLIYQPTATTTFKLIYGEAFRAPNNYERYYNDGGSTMMSNPGLKPENIRTYEAVWEQYFGTVYSTTVSGYYSQIDNLITQITDPASGLLVFQNIEKVDTIGAEVALQAKWENGLQGRLSYTWQDASNAGTGARLYNSPRNMAKANISFPLFRTNLFLSPELQYTSPRLTRAGNLTKDVVLVNLTLFGRDLIKGLEASASVYNLFNTSYGDPVGADLVQDTIRQNGIFITSIFILTLVLVLSVRAGTTEMEEYKIKSGMLFNFTYFVEWPPESLNKTRTLNVCIAGNNPSNRSFHQLHGKPFKDRTIIVRHIREPGSIAGCNMLFLNRSESHQLPAYLQMAYKRSILTVSDIENFASQGGIIGFIEQNGKVRFEINLDAAQQSKIRINSRLLNLARIIPGRK